MKPSEDDADDDEVYQYPKAGLGPVFASMESLLRCAICRGLSGPPVSLPCCQQTFCSLCIRQYLDCAKPRCPCCRSEAGSNQLQMCKELRSICLIWTRNRKAILAAAKASSDAAAAAGGATAAPAPSPAAAEETRPSGHRRVRGLGAGQGRDGGRMQKVYYHQLNETKIKQKLIEVGLPVGGGKAAMVERHKRLALLDAASNDREVPLKRRELIRQVAVWEEAKDKEKKATAARSAAGGVVAAPATAAPGAAGGRAGQPARSVEGAGEASVPPEAEKIVIPKKMQAGFSALIASARKNAKKRSSISDSADGASGNSSVVKKARVSEDSISTSDRGGGDGGGDGGSDGAVICNGSLSEDGAYHNSGDGVGKRRTINNTAIGNGIAPWHDAGGAADMQILGVAGRMIRTRGPWQCAFSSGVPPPPSPLTSVAKRQGSGPVPVAAVTAAAAAGDNRPAKECAEKQEEKDRSTGKDPISASGGCPGNSDTRNGCADAAASGGRVNEHGGERPAVAINGLARRVSSESGARDDDDVGDSEASGRGKATDTVPAEAVRDAGFLYVNTTTGETAREPPAELCARREEARSAGEYLVFVPSHSFVAAVASNSTVCTDIAASGEAVPMSSSLSEAASAVGAAAERVLQAVDNGPCSSARDEAAAEADGNGDGSGRRTAAAPEPCGRQEQRSSYQSPLEAPTPPTAVKREGGTPSGSGGSGGETWDRFSSLPTIDLSQGVASAPLDVDDVGTGNGKGGGGTGEACSAGGGEGVGPAEGAGKVVATMWTCDDCTLLNVTRRTICEVCKKPRSENFGPRHGVVKRGKDEGVGGLSGRAGSGKLRLGQRRNSGSAPQSSITSFTARPVPPEIADNGKGKGSGRGSMVASSSATATATAAATAAAGPCSRSSLHPSPPPAGASLTAAVAPTNFFPTVRSQERSSSAAASTATTPAAAADKTQQ